MHILLLSSDLMLISSAQGIADRRGVKLQIAASVEQAVQSSEGAVAVAIDLRTPGLDIGAAVPKLRKTMKPHATVLAFGPHVHTEALRAAAAAGCDEVITRGQFEHRFDALLGKCAMQARSHSERSEESGGALDSSLRSE